MIAKTKPAVGYIRMSTDKQEDSPTRQRRDIETLADRQNYRITGWYEDHGLTGTESLNRPEFQRLLKNAKTGKFEAILLSEQSRMSREDVFDAMMHWKILRDAGVRIVTCQRGELDFSNLGGVITAIVDQYGAREESVKLAQRVVSGQRLKVMNGHRIGGIVYGYDREVHDEKGKFVRRVHFQERFKSPNNWSTKMVVSQDRKAVNAIRWAFQAYAEGKSQLAIVAEFRRRELLTVYRNQFTISAINGLLTNPAYAGILRVGKWSRSKFCTVAEEGLVVIENAHDAIVSRELFDEVQEALADRKRTRVRSRKYLLSGMIRCQHCGRTLHGVQRRCRAGGPKMTYYQCGNSLINGRKKCPNPCVRTERIEEFVLDAIRSHLLSGDMDDRIRRAIVIAKRQAEKGAKRDFRRLAELRRKIDRGTENLALADKDEFAAISKLLCRWRDEEFELAQRIEEPDSDLKPLPDALKVLGRFADIHEKLAKANVEKLADAIEKTIGEISIRIGDARTGRVEHRELVGTLAFHDAFGIPPIDIPDEAIGQRKIWRELADLVRQSNRPLHLKDFCEHIGTTDASHAAYHVRRAEKACLIQKVGHQGGWVGV